MKRFLHWFWWELPAYYSIPAIAAIVVLLWKVLCG
jgi:hypothetical protein